MKDFKGFKSEEEYHRVLDLIEEAGMTENDKFRVGFDREENTLNIVLRDNPSDISFRFPFLEVGYQYELTFLPDCTYHLAIIPIEEIENAPYYAVYMTNEKHLICVVHQLIQQYYNKEFDFVFEED